MSLDKRRAKIAGKRLVKKLREKFTPAVATHQAAIAGSGLVAVQGQYYKSNVDGEGATAVTNLGRPAAAFYGTGGGSGAVVSAIIGSSTFDYDVIEQSDSGGGSGGGVATVFDIEPALGVWAYELTERLSGLTGEPMVDEDGLPLYDPVLDESGKPLLGNVNSGRGKVVLGLKLHPNERLQLDDDGRLLLADDFAGKGLIFNEDGDMLIDLDPTGGLGFNLEGQIGISESLAGVGLERNLDTGAIDVRYGDTMTITPILDEDGQPSGEIKGRLDVKTAPRGGLEIWLDGLALRSDIGGAGLQFLNGKINTNPGKGISIYDDNLTINVADNSGLGFKNLLDEDRNTTGEYALTLLDTVAGNGLSFDAGVLNVNTGNGLGIFNDELSVSIGQDSGLTLLDGNIRLGQPSTLSSTSVNQRYASTHTHAIISTDDPINNPGVLLRSAPDGGLTLNRLTTPLINSNSDLLLQPAGDVLLDADLASDTWVSGATGWGISMGGDADFRNIEADTLTVEAFVAAVNRVHDGSLIVPKSKATLNRNFSIPSVSRRMYVEDIPGYEGYQNFSSGDHVLMKYMDRSGGGLIIGEAVGTVKSYRNEGDGEQSWVWVRETGKIGQVVHKGIVALDFGIPGDGWWEATSVKSHSPYSQVATWAGANPVTGTVNVYVRTGKLDGLAGVPDQYGIWAGTSDQYIWAGEQGISIQNAALNIIDSPVYIGAADNSSYFQFDPDTGQAELKGWINVIGGLTVSASDVDGLGALAFEDGVTVDASEVTGLGSLATQNDVTVNAGDVIGLGDLALLNGLAAGDITGLGGLATLNGLTAADIAGLGDLAVQDSVVINAGDVNGLGNLATQNSINVGQVTGLGSLATQNRVSIGIVDGLGQYATVDLLTTDDISGLGPFAVANTATAEHLLALGELAHKDVISVQAIRDIGDLALLDVIDTSQVEGLGTLATLDRINTTLMDGLGLLATRDDVHISEVMGAGNLASRNTVASRHITGLNVSKVQGLGDLALIDALTADDIDGLGSLATLNDIEIAMVSGLGALAGLDQVPVDLIIDGGALLRANNLDEIFDGSVFGKVKNSALTPDGLVVMDALIEGTYGKILTTALTSEGMVNMDTIVDGDYARVKQSALTADGLVFLDNVVSDGDYGLIHTTNISAGRIVLSKVDGDLDDVANGNNYAKIRSTIVDAGYIQIGSGSPNVNLHGWRFNPSKIFGQKNGVTQVELALDGTIEAAAGKLRLSSAGLDFQTGTSAQNAIGWWKDMSDVTDDWSSVMDSASGYLWTNSDGTQSSTYLINQQFNDNLASHLRIGAYNKGSSNYAQIMMYGHRAGGPIGWTDNVGDSSIAINANDIKINTQQTSIYTAGHDFRVIDKTKDTKKYYIWRSESAGKLYLGADHSVPTLRYHLDMNGYDILNADELEADVIRAEEMHVQSFIADNNLALTGSQIVGKSVAKLARDVYIGTGDVYIYVFDAVGAPGSQVFAAWDWVQLRYASRSGGGLTTGKITGTVSSYQNQGDGTQRWRFRYKSGNSGVTVYAGNEIVDYGKSGDGLWGVTTLLHTAPFAQVVTWNEHPDNTTVHTRTGRIDGITNHSEKEFGFYAGMGDKKIIASDRRISLVNTDIDIRDGTFRVGNNSTYLHWDGDKLSIHGSGSGLTEIDGGKITTNSIDANKLNVTHLEALSAKTGDLTVDGDLNVATSGVITAGGARIDKDGISLNAATGLLGSEEYQAQFGDHAFISATNSGGFYVASKMPYQTSSPDYGSGEEVLFLYGNGIWLQSEHEMVVTSEKNIEFYTQPTAMIRFSGRSHFDYDVDMYGDLSVEGRVEAESLYLNGEQVLPGGGSGGGSVDWSEITPARVRITSAGYAALDSTDHALQIGPTNSTNIIMDRNEILARNNGNQAPLYLNHKNPDSYVSITGKLYAHQDVSIAGELDLGGNDINSVRNMTATGTMKTRHLYGNSALTVTVNDADFVVRDTTDTPQYYIWRDHSASALYLGTPAAVPTFRANVNMDGNDITNVGDLEVDGTLAVGGSGWYDDQGLFLRNSNPDSRGFCIGPTSVQNSYFYTKGVYLGHNTHTQHGVFVRGEKFQVDTRSVFNKDIDMSDNNIVNASKIHASALHLGSSGFYDDGIQFLRNLSPDNRHFYIGPTSVKSSYFYTKALFLGHNTYTTSGVYVKGAKFQVDAPMDLNNHIDMGSNDINNVGDLDVNGTLSIGASGFYDDGSYLRNYLPNNRHFYIGPTNTKNAFIYSKNIYLGNSYYQTQKVYVNSSSFQVDALSTLNGAVDINGAVDMGGNDINSVRNMAATGTMKTRHLYGNSALTVTVNDADFVVRDTTDAPQYYIWRDHSASALYLGTPAAIPTFRANVNMNGNDITNVDCLEVDGDIDINGYLSFKEGMPTPATRSGRTVLWVDSNRRLKMKDSTGRIRTVG